MLPVSPETLAREAAEHPVSKFAPKTKRALGPLTERQREVLICIRKWIEAYQYPPTIRDLGRLMNIKSTNGVIDHLRALERKGMVIRDPLRSRALTLTQAGRNA